MTPVNLNIAVYDNVAVSNPVKISIGFIPNNYLTEQDITLSKFETIFLSAILTNKFTQLGILENISINSSPPAKNIFLINPTSLPLVFNNPLNKIISKSNKVRAISNDYKVN